MNRHAQVEADPDKVESVAKFLVDTLDEFLKENPQSATDLFMGVHGFHHLVIRMIANTWEKEGIPKNQTFRMADMTWRKAMKEEWRNA